MSPHKLLVVAPAWVGDAIMAQSLYKTLHQHHPNITLDVLAPAWIHPILMRMPDISKTWVNPFLHGQLQLKQRYQLGRQLSKEHYEQVIILPNSFKSALVPFWADIPKRTGFKGEARWGLLNDMRHLNKTALPLMIERFISLGLPSDAPRPNPLPYPRLTIAPETVEATLKKHRLMRPEKLLVLCPGAEYGPSKRWPPAHYGKLAQHHMTKGWQVWILGSEKEKQIAQAIQASCTHGCVDLTGNTTLEEAIDLMSLADQVVTNDSGLMHIAAALSRPLIALYGSSSAQFTPPLSHTARQLSLSLPCSPCFQRTCPLGHFKCLRDLSPARVIEAIETGTQ